MFSKPSSDGQVRVPLGPPEPRPAAPPASRPIETTRAPDRGASVIGPDVRVRGGIEGSGEIHLQGRAWGDVRVERLLVAETAELEGSITANVVEVRGRVVGPIEAHAVRLLSTARVEGDITYEQLHIEPGAHFDGRCARAVRSAAPAAQAPTEAEVEGPVAAPAAAPEPQAHAEAA